MKLEELQMAKLQAYAFVAMVGTFQYCPVNHLVKLPKSCQACLPSMKFILLQMLEL